MIAQRLRKALRLRPGAPLDEIKTAVARHLRELAPADLPRLRAALALPDATSDQIEVTINRLLDEEGKSPMKPTPTSTSTRDAREELLQLAEQRARKTGRPLRSELLQLADEQPMLALRAMNDGEYGPLRFLAEPAPKKTWDTIVVDEDENPRLRLARLVAQLARDQDISQPEALQQIALEFPDLWVRAQSTY